MRHMIRSLPTLTHIFPRTMKVIPPNIFFSSTRGTRANASLTRLVRSLTRTTRILVPAYFGKGELSNRNTSATSLAKAEPRGG